MGLKPGEVVGLSALEMYKDNPEVLKGLRKALDGEAHRSTTFVGDVAFNVYYSPYRDYKGEITGTIGMAVDITEQKMAEKTKTWMAARQDLE